MASLLRTSPVSGRRAPFASFRAHRRAQVTRAFATRGALHEDASFPDGIFDAYEVLQVPDDASALQVRESFVALQKKYHPDVYDGEDVATRSAWINRAYDILTSDDARSDLDRALREANGGRRARATTIISAHGIVGPLREILLARMDVCGGETEKSEICDVDVAERMTESIREWGKMLAFTSELPLPLPLQCDDVENGLRLALVAFENGSVREVGALEMTVETSVSSPRDPLASSITVHDDDEVSVTVRVARKWAEVANPTAYESNPLPGEARILGNFAEEFAFLVGDAQGAEVEGASGILGIFSNVVSAVSSFALPILPMFGGHDGRTPGGAYDGYRIRKKRKTDAPEASDATRDEEEKDECGVGEACGGLFI